MIGYFKLDKNVSSTNMDNLQKDTSNNVFTLYKTTLFESVDRKALYNHLPYDKINYKAKSVLSMSPLPPFVKTSIFPQKWSLPILTSSYRDVELQGITHTK